MEVEVYYIDSIEGGSGSTRTSLNSLPFWLATRPGILIREITPLLSFKEMEAYAETRKQAVKNLGHTLFNKY